MCSASVCTSTTQFRFKQDWKLIGFLGATLFLFFFFSSFLADGRSPAAALEKTFIGFPTQNFALVFSYLKIFFICRFSYLFFFISLWGWEFDDIIIVFSFLFINFHRSWKKRKKKLEHFTTLWHIFKNFPKKCPYLKL